MNFLKNNLFMLASLATMGIVPCESTEPVSNGEAQKHREAYFLPNANLDEADIQDDQEQRVWVTYRVGEHDRILRILDSFADFPRLKGSRLSRMRVNYDFGRINSFVITASQQIIDILESNPAVLSIEPDQKRELQYLPESVRQLQWTTANESARQQMPYGISMVQADQLWEAGITGAGVKVCVVDSGIDRFHEDFASESLDGYETNEQWRRDGVGHGTHVSGTIAAADNDVGVIGVAPDAQIYTVKVFADDGAFLYASGLVGAAYQCQSVGANIVSMSLGGPFPSFAEFGAYDDLLSQGVLLIAASGNNGSSRKSFPASYSGVISVGALDSKKEVAPFSQYNDRVDIAAPGVDVLSTFPMDGNCQICESTESRAYGVISGTSMATPHVSGVAALLWSYKPEATAEEIMEALLLSAEDLGPSGRDDMYGYGLVQATAALQYLAFMH